MRISILAALSLLWISVAAADETQGVFVAKALPGGLPSGIGLQENDLITAVRPSGTPGRFNACIDSIVDWLWLSQNTPSKREIILVIRRDGKDLEVELPGDMQDVVVRPPLGPGESEMYARILNHDLDTASLVREWELLSSRLAHHADPSLSVWAYLNLAEIYSTAGQKPPALAAYQSATERSREPQSRTLIAASVAKHFEQAGDLDKSQRTLEIALKHAEKVTGSELIRARLLNALARIDLAEGNRAAASELLQKALALHELLGDADPGLVETLRKLGDVAQATEALVIARGYYGRALAVQERIDPASSATADILNDLGIIETELDELAAARAHHQRALDLRRRSPLESADLDDSLHNLAIVEIASGNVESARLLLEQELNLLQARGAEDQELAACYYTLGTAAFQAENLESALRYFMRDLQITEKLEPGSLKVATTANSLGAVEYSRGNLAAAEAWHQKALEIRRRLAPRSLAMASTLNNLGNLESSRNRPKKAEAYYRQVLDIRQERTPDSLDVAYTLKNLADVVEEQGRLVEAREYLDQGLQIIGRLAPGTSADAITLQASSVLAYRMRNIPLALEHSIRSLNALENQISRMGMDQDQMALFRADYAFYYRNSIALFVEVGSHTLAFDILERSRAQSLRAMLAERDLLASAVEIPRELRERRDRAVAEYNITLEALQEARSSGKGPAADALNQRLRDLDLEYTDIKDEIRRSSPRVASVQYPQPIGLLEAQATLEPGTVLLSYSVSVETILFAVTRERFSVHKIRLSKADLQRKVDLFNSLIQSRDRMDHPRFLGLADMGKSLFADLIEPARSTVESASRILIAPDGPLHFLPWSALIVNPPGGNNRPGELMYLAEWKPLHFNLSATLYQFTLASRKSRPPLGESSLLAAFGDPPSRLYDPLPASRAEIDGIRRIFETTQVFLGQEATEAAAKFLPPSTRFVHFATHAIPDEERPLYSAVVLAPSPGSQETEEGLLQAWEIFEQVRLNADLVALSACDGARGKELGGEGLLSLTRAFQYAGARSVLASLWKISDRTTAELMVRFYKHLKEGKTKDEALRATQIELIRGPIEITNEKGEVEEVDASMPYHWAAFQLYGDWQ